MHTQAHDREREREEQRTCSAQAMSEWSAGSRVRARRYASPQESRNFSYEETVRKGEGIMTEGERDVRERTEWGMRRREKERRGKDRRRGESERERERMTRDERGE